MSISFDKLQIVRTDWNYKENLMSLQISAKTWALHSLLKLNIFLPFVFLFDIISDFLSLLTSKLLQEPVSVFFKPCHHQNGHPSFCAIRTCTSVTPLIRGKLMVEVSCCAIKDDTLQNLYSFCISVLWQRSSLNSPSKHSWIRRTFISVENLYLSLISRT